MFNTPLDDMSGPALKLACELRRLDINLVGQRRTGRGRADQNYRQAMDHHDTDAFMRWHKEQAIAAALRQMGFKRVRLGASRLFVRDEQGQITPDQWRRLRRHVDEFLDLLCGPSAQEGNE